MERIQLDSSKKNGMPLKTKMSISLSLPADQVNIYIRGILDPLPYQSAVTLKTLMNATMTFTKFLQIRPKH